VTETSNGPSDGAVDEPVLFSIHRADLPTYLAFAETHQHVFFSKALRAWVSLDPEMSIGLIRDRRLAAVGTEAPLAAFAKRFGCPMPAMILAAGHIPAMLEGNAHASVRRSLAIILADKRDALATAMSRLAEMHVRPLYEENEIDLVAAVLVPLTASVFGTVLGVGSSMAAGRFAGARIFDRFASLAALREAEAEMAETLADIRRKLGEDCLEAAVGARLALNVLGRDTIVGTFGAGLIRLIPSADPVRLDAIEYPEGLPDTGVPFVERVAREEFGFRGNLIRSGDRFRLYLRGLLGGEDRDPRQLFGVGHHACLGRQLSLDLWGCLTAALSAIPRSARLVDIAYEDDNFFNIPRSVRLGLSS
jgi:cytochrome P450